MPEAACRRKRPAPSEAHLVRFFTSEGYSDYARRYGERPASPISGDSSPTGGWWLLLLVGALSVVAGVILLFKPSDSLATLAVIAGIFLLLDGILELVYPALPGAAGPPGPRFGPARSGHPAQGTRLDEQQLVGHKRDRAHVLHPDHGEQPLGLSDGQSRRFSGGALLFLQRCR